MGLRNKKKKKKNGFSCFLTQSYDLISSEVRAFNRVTVTSCVGKIGEIFKGALTKEKKRHTESNSVMQRESFLYHNPVQFIIIACQARNEP